MAAEDASKFGPSRNARATWAGLLFGAVLVASVLRFTGLGWGLRQVPHSDESAFVDNAARMIRDRTLDHGFYEYPGLFLYLLVPAQVLAAGEGAKAYLAARAVVAAFGVATVGVAFALGRRLAGPWCGFTAAVLLAVSPLAVETAHMVRPDVVLGFFALLALRSQHQLGDRLTSDVRAGAALGLATGVKFTGLLLVPSYLFASVLRPGSRNRGLAAVLALSTAVLVGLAVTPYALLSAHEFAKGAYYQIAFHYPTDSRGATYAATLVFLLRQLSEALGLIGAVLAILGLATALRRGREWWPMIVYPMVTVLVHASAQPCWPRFLLPPLGVVTLLVGLAVSRIARHRPVLGGVALAAAVVPPLWTSADYSYRMSQPTAQDRALDWITANVPARSLILETRASATPGGGRPGAMLGLDPLRYEVRYTGPRTPWNDLALLARHADLVVTSPGAGRGWQASLRTSFEATGPMGEVVMRLRTVDPAERPQYDTLPLATATLRSSAGALELPLVRDRSLETSWTVAAGRAWLSVELPERVEVGRIEMVPGIEGRGASVSPRLFVTEDGITYRGAPYVPLRPEIPDQRTGRTPSEVLLLRPTNIRGFRLERADSRPVPWSVAELIVGRVPMNQQATGSARPSANEATPGQR